MEGHEAIYSAILDSVKLGETFNVLELAAETKLTEQINYVENLDLRRDKLKEMRECMALEKFLTLMKYIKGDGVPSSVLGNYEKHLDYILSVLR